MWPLLFVGLALGEAEITFEPEDGRCQPGEDLVVFAPEFDTGSARECSWIGDAWLLSDAGVAESLILECPGCSGRSEDMTVGIYANCGESGQNQVWVFGEIVVACSEVWEPGPEEDCGCGSRSAPALWSLLLVPCLFARRRRHPVPVSPADGLFSASTIPDAPVRNTHPTYPLARAG